LITNGKLHNPFKYFDPILISRNFSFKDIEVLVQSECNNLGQELSFEEGTNLSQCRLHTYFGHGISGLYHTTNTPQSLSNIILLHHSSGGKEHTMIRDEIIIVIDPTFMQSGII
jgi:hypothetical protein